jgi:23S rRNA pseudouridine2604 synthase
MVAFMSDSIRLAKRVAELFHCSRAEATLYIEGAGVTVDGVVVEEPGFRVTGQEQIALLPSADLTPIEDVTIMLHKPAGMSVGSVNELIVAENQAAEDRSGIRFLKRHLKELVMLDPLENAASGLLVFTQDWRVKRKLVDDLSRVEQEFVVEVSGQIIEGGLELLNQSINFNGKPSAPAKVSWQNETRLRFARKELSSRLITLLCERVGLSVVSIKRIRMGRIPMGGLIVGQWRYLMGYERF